MPLAGRAGIAPGGGLPVGAAVSLRDMIDLIIPDIHQRLDQARAILERWEDAADRVVFIGDYFDPKPRRHGDCAGADETLEWLLDSLERPNRIHLLGNHDLSYRWPEVLACSGHDEAVFRLIARRAGGEGFWGRFEYCLESQGWLISHAGVHPALFPHVAEGPELVPAALAASEALRRAPDPLSILLQPGLARGGIQEVGGFPWLDWREEFEPVPGISQIVGHTYDAAAVRRCVLTAEGSVKRRRYRLEEGLPSEPFPRPDGGASDNWCLDCGLEAFALLKNGALRLLSGFDFGGRGS